MDIEKVAYLARNLKKIKVGEYEFTLPKGANTIVIANLGDGKIGIYPKCFNGVGFSNGFGEKYIEGDFKKINGDLAKKFEKINL